MTKKISNEPRLRHILEAINNIENFTSQLTFSDFFSNNLVKSATVRELEIIGEAANHLTQELKNKYNEVNWEEIIGLRNIIIHEYFTVDYEVVWEIVNNDIQPLKSIVIKILNEELSNQK
jgi:uncharacterized protein with HEPN domain